MSEGKSIILLPQTVDRIAADLPAAELIEQLGQLPWPGLRAVVEAPPGAGKTTVVPPALAARAVSSSGRVIVTQPRRVAARSAARRLAQLTGTSVGQYFGFTVRGQREVTEETAVEFVTSGVLLRRLISNPDLPGVHTVVLDEVHERHLESDLVFAFLQQLGQLRPELNIVVMSATLDTDRWAQLLAPDTGNTVPVLAVRTRTYPLHEVWAPSPVRALDDRGVTTEFLTHVAATVREHTHTTEGDILVFLPGIREIKQVQQQLSGALVLTGQTPPAEQDRILGAQHHGMPRIILATNVAESALTIPGVRLVVDAGLDRQQRLDTVRGMSGLVTVGAAKSALVQRAGRAAREGPGTVVRCMNQAEYSARPAHTPPAIATSDLTSAVLDVACWGAPRGEGLALPDPFPPRALSAAERTLTSLGALKEGVATALGHQLSTVPADPRLARALFQGAELVGAELTAQVIAALNGDYRAPGGDIWGLLRQLRSTQDRVWRHETRRLSALISDAVHSTTEPLVEEEELAVGLVTALAYPDQVAHLRPRAERDYLLASGTGAQLPASSALKGQPWLVIAQVGLHQDRPVIRAATGITRDLAELAAASLRTSHTVAHYNLSTHRLSARDVERLGAIELSSTPVKAAGEPARQAIAEVLAEHGLTALFSLPDSFTSLRARLGLLHRVFGDPWPDVRWTALNATIGTWLEPELEQLVRGVPAAKIEVTAALRRLLPWPAASELDVLVPQRIAVPSGSHAQVRYPEPEVHDDHHVSPPVLAVKLQECFGWAAGPRVCQERVPVLLHLLSPARRPLAITADLSNFWHQVYPQVRAENRGRYPKHPWPEDPWTATATAGTQQRR